MPIEISREPDRAVAVVQSLLVPGLGSITSGHHLRGMVWFVCVVASYVFFGRTGSVWSAAGLHLLCVLAAAYERPPVTIVYMSPGAAEMFTQRQGRTPSRT